MTKNKSGFPWVLIIMLVCIAVVILLLLALNGNSRDRFESQMTVSAEQIKAIGAAVKAFEAKRAKRPKTLEQLVEADLLEGSQLYDKRRGKVKWSVDPETHHFTPHPDVLYFPAMRSSDPPDLVLLCSLLLENDDDKYQVITNNGAHYEMDRNELVSALQRTYTHIGRGLRETVHRKGS